MKRKSMPVKIFRSFEEQEAWEIQYYVSLTPEERQRIARELRERVYGQNSPGIRDANGRRGK